MIARLARLAFAVVLAGGCGHSALIRSDDTAYRRSLDRLRHTRQLVAESGAPDDDQAMFLQAESLYRYRFAEPGRSAGSYMAQTAAAAINLPVLEAFAGAINLYSLRLKTYDGAVQLWETMLARNPTSPLRPLTLYRLGWAYRNSIASGLPGTSAGSFDEILEKYATSPVAPFAAQARRIAWKSESRATMWSLVPGLGQIYAGEVRNGLVRLTIALAADAMIVVPSVIAYQRRDDLSWSHDWPLFTTAIAGAIILATDYSSSYQDALRAVIEHNERGEAEFDAAHPDAP
jgi:hypothetical protein